MSAIVSSDGEREGAAFLNLVVWDWWGSELSVDVGCTIKHIQISIVFENRRYTERL